MCVCVCVCVWYMYCRGHFRLQNNPKNLNLEKICVRSLFVETIPYAIHACIKSILFNSEQLKDLRKRE